MIAAVHADPGRSTWDAIAAQIAAGTGARPGDLRSTALAGGSINRAFLLRTDAGEFFVKLNRAGRADMFEAEAEGLREIAATHSVRVPQPLCAGGDETHCWLVLERLPLRRQGDWPALGEALAALHRHGAGTFGWHRDNTIGATLQPNRPGNDWITFFREQRLGHQFRLAAGNGYRSLAAGADRLLERLPALFPGYRPAPSLLHGDLWSGNAAFLPGGTGVIYDPAVYYGDREADIAMTELFGGFPASFYQAYQAAWALDPGYRLRKRLYNLYHQLNHLNLFGAGYLAACEDAIARLLAETG